MALELNKYELAAKSHFINLVTDGSQTPIDAADWSTFDFQTPPWFNEAKFNLGRQYFMENRFGILSTNLCGLVMLLAIPKGLAILRATKMSNTPETARKRYVDTIMHTLSWYNVQLKNDTKSWESLMKVRKYHLIASNLGLKKKIGFISQMEVSMTTFGFAGLALIRPHLFGIDTSSTKKRKAFLHFWAVLNRLLGVQDQFNIGLQPLKAAEIEFDLIMRHSLLPYLQIETVLFKKMVNALINGLQIYMPYFDYDSQIFLIRRATGVPGYQFDVDLSKEVPHRNIFTPADIQRLQTFYPKFSEKIQIVKVKRNNLGNFDCNNYMNSTITEEDNYMLNYFNRDPEFLRKLMGLPCGSEIKIKELDKDENFVRFLSAKQFYKLGSRSRFYVDMATAMISLMKFPRGVDLMNRIVDVSIDVMQNKTTYAQHHFNMPNQYPFYTHNHFLQVPAY